MSSVTELAALTLGGESTEERLRSLERKLAADRKAGFTPPGTGEVNNHVHTVYSFSPYTPAEAAYGAWRAGLEAVGIIDHESVGGNAEMLEAGRRIGIAATSGCELRVDAAGSRIAGRKINNPDSKGLLYMVIHGIPRQGRAEVEAFLAPVRESRNRRNRAQVNTLNRILDDAGFPTLDFDRDIVPLSKSPEGGSITERHILYALARQTLERFGDTLISSLESRLGLVVPESIGERLTTSENPHRAYDLLGLFKGSFVPRFFQQPDQDECRPVAQATALADRVGGIPAYAYLGDVGESPTGDKKAEAYEDAWLDDLFDALPEMGFRAVTYMPPRNTKEQLERVKAKCAEKDLMEISGVDINSSRQSFRCPEVTLPQFAHLNDRTWALIAHEHLASRKSRLALFSADNPLATSSLDDRLAVYARLGQAMDPRNPDSIVDAARKEGLWTD